MLIYYALNITSLKVTDRAKPRVRNSPTFSKQLLFLVQLYIPIVSKFQLKYHLKKYTKNAKKLVDEDAFGQCDRLIS